MSSLIKRVRHARSALLGDDGLSPAFKMEFIMGVVIDLASRIERAEGAPRFSADERGALDVLIDAWRVAEPPAMPFPPGGPTWIEEEA
jgi:hypothetical protein